MQNAFHNIGEVTVSEHNKSKNCSSIKILGFPIDSQINRFLRKNLFTVYPPM